MAGAYVRLDIGIVKIDTSFFDPSERIIEIRQPSPDRLDFGAGENDTCLQPFQYLVAMKSSPIGDDIRTHSRLPLVVAGYPALLSSLRYSHVRHPSMISWS